jgi:outer membrane murein-binding lipoprotein Lpp
MIVRRRVGILLTGTAIGAYILFAGPALADEVDLQRQINAMQRQLKAMQEQLAKSKEEQAQQARAAQEAAQKAQKAAQSAEQVYAQAAGAPAHYPPGTTMFAKALPSSFDKIHISMAGTFIALEGAWREHSEVSDGASSPPFGSPGIPLANSALFNEREFRMTAQQSRIALRAWGDISPTQHLEAYYEMDFLGASVDANSRESNSYVPRIRQGFASYDNDDYHIHFLGGQAWSMLTQDRVGITPRYENVPLTIDAQYVVGFNWLRNPQLRFVADWNNIAWFGVSVEQPGAVFPGAPSAGTVAPPGTAVSINNFCTTASHLNGSTSCSNDVAPDIIEKFALDPGWGHYEVLALQRWISDEVSPTITPASWSQQTTFGWGVGGSFLVPAIPNFVDLQGSVLYGEGIGRYSSSQLPDAVIGPTGSLTPVKGLQFMLGAVAHPWNGLDIYTYYGQDQTYANPWTAGGINGGWGNANFLNNGCLDQSLTAGGSALGAPPFNTPIGGTTCTFDVQRVQEFTIGFWQTIYQGDLGRAVAGAQYEYVKLTAFPGLPGPITSTLTPNQGLNPNNNIFMFSFRYYPFN